jgi:hypothetical protein
MEVVEMRLPITRGAVPAIGVIAVLGLAACGGSNSSSVYGGVNNNTSISAGNYHAYLVHGIQAKSSLGPNAAVAAADCIVAAFQKAGYQTVSDVQSHKTQSAAMAGGCGAYAGLVQSAANSASATNTNGGG